LHVLAALALLFSTASGAPAPTPAAAGALAILDLASDTAWTLRLDDAAPRPIKVPGGGWNSDLQQPPIQVMMDVRDHVLYERMIDMPAAAQGQVVKLRFGAVTYGCEVFLDGKKVGEHHGPQVAFEIDLTDEAAAGKQQALQVKAFHRRHYLKPGENRTADVAVGFDFPEGGDAASRSEANTWCNWHGQTKLGYGIVRSIALVVLPAVHVQETFVKPSVTKQQLECGVWLRNATDQGRKVTLGAALSSWNQRDWKYPPIPPIEVTVPARGVTKVLLGPVAWNLGSDSYWWPNIPFREAYVPQLHVMELTISEGQKIWQKFPQRFGFVEHAEGPFYYTVNGVRVTGISDGTTEGCISYFDSYGRAAAFLPPTSPGTGCAETWRRYMRIGININRLSCSPPTALMLDAADETGFMLVPETPIWGNGLSRYNPTYTPQTYQDLGRLCRNHPSLARYSLANEVREPVNNAWPWRAAIDDLREVDDVHPMVFEMQGQGSGRVDGVKGGHAFIMEHYTNIHEKVGEGKGIRGMGEHFWERNSMGEFAVGVRTLRMNDWCYMAGWCWLNYWPNFLEGMNHDLHAWKPQDHTDRKDGVDGWGSPIVTFTQQSLHPYLLQDRELLDTNPDVPRGEDKGQAEWPYQIPACHPGDKVERHIEVFNDGLAGNRLTLHWSAHWDQPDGPLALAGGDIPCEIEPGFHATKPITFAVPTIDRAQRKLYLVMESRKEGKTVFREESTWLNVIAGK